MAQPFYDIFITRAYEDEHEFTGKLAFAFKQKGLKVWYSGFELKRGTSMASGIKKALAESAFGVLVVGPTYFSRLWAIRELKWLLAEESGKGRLLVVLHGISMKVCRTRLPLLPEHPVVSFRMGIENIVSKVLMTVQAKQKERTRGGIKKVSGRSAKARKVSVEGNGVIVLGGETSTENTSEPRVRKRKSKKK